MLESALAKQRVKQSLQVTRREITTHGLDPNSPPRMPGRKRKAYKIYEVK